MPDNNQPKNTRKKSSVGSRRKLLPWLIPFASVRLTLALLSLSMILIFIATLEQVRIGIRGAQAEFFESLYGIWYYPVQFWGSEFLSSIPVPIPGGYLLGGLLILNLIAAFIVRFQWSSKKIGIQLIHLGIILLLIGQMITQAKQVESRMMINKGETSNYIERFHGVELAFTNVTNPSRNQVVAIPQALLERGGIFNHKDLPFDVSVRKFDRNCDVTIKQPDQSRQGLSKEVNRGVGFTSNLFLKEKEEDYSMDGLNFSFVVFDLINDNKSMGTWLALTHPAGNHVWKSVSPQLADFAFQPLRHQGNLWGMTLRHEREYLPFSITLRSIANEFYQGTEIPYNFESKVTLNLDEDLQRDALVYMNTPLRHGGKTFYQYQMNKAADYSVFQVIRNPSWLLPYLACILVSIGLLWQFSFHLFSFLRKHKSTPRLA